MKKRLVKWIAAGVSVVLVTGLLVFTYRQGVEHFQGMLQTIVGVFLTALLAFWLRPEEQSGQPPEKK
ncbi:hypothetical protein [Deinococcus cellulosilyticus]|uniref:Uncharacterized protein n=1 Tax=Deinococcus cellulosilyticus (strain DSM 18568 / NBRC 106333 / KACC 11606 / 5516J-15) TaxID=1223518 RepID=A0A511NCP6_DEIC1|nr:hypothetical protein [Deinococcus cellulosilyticus]GEM50111.1 hypothetical protein DC3_57460 [Deinococcus cellulosilyticus NBRC 106333 = KACC 11606]